MPRRYRQSRRRYARRRTWTRKRARSRYRGGRRRYGRRRRGFATKRMLTQPRNSRSVIYRYTNGQETGTAGALVNLQISSTQSVGVTTFALNDIHFFCRSQNGVANTAPTEIPSKREWYQWYTRWKVHLVEFTATIINSGTQNPYYIALIANPTKQATGSVTSITSGWANYTTIFKTNKFSTYKILTDDVGKSNKATIKLRIPIGKLSGDTGYRIDEDFNGSNTTVGAGTSPPYVFTLELVVANMSGAGEASLRTFPCSITANLFVKHLSRSFEVA